LAPFRKRSLGRPMKRCEGDVSVETDRMKVVEGVQWTAWPRAGSGCGRVAAAAVRDLKSN
jgi:hypothetical protein